MTLSEFLDLERTCRKSGRWFSGSFQVTNDHNVTVSVAVKSYDTYNQILRINSDGVDYASGHTIDKIKQLQDHYRNVINQAKV